METDVAGPPTAMETNVGVLRGDVKRNAEIKTHFTVMLLLLDLL